MKFLTLLIVALLMLVPMVSFANVAEDTNQIAMVTSPVELFAADESVITIPVLAAEDFTQASQYSNTKQMIPITGIEAATLDAYDIYREAPHRTAISIAGQ